jgi:hypothetical protein
MAGRSRRGDDRRVADLEDTVKQRDRRIEELRQEVDDLRALVQRLREHIEDTDSIFEQWKEAFEMTLGDDGKWQWSPDIVTGEEWCAKYTALVRKWNAAVDDFNATIKPRGIGRPLAASEAECIEVLELHKQGRSLRGIVEDLPRLGFQTVRTIVDKRGRRDRTSVKHLERIDPERARVKVWLGRKQRRDRLPKQIQQVQDASAKLVKEAKGLGRT